MPPDPPTLFTLTHTQWPYQSEIAGAGPDTAVYNFATNMLKAHLSFQASSFSVFVISNTHIVAQKSCGRQLNAKVCGSRSAIFRILLSLLRLCSNNDNSKTAQVLTLILAQN